MSHTPGPWRCVPNPFRYDGYFVLAGEVDQASTISEMIAQQSISHGQFKSEADADLASAAPDLLAALKDLIEDDMERIPQKKLDAAIAAIAKAEGR